MNKKFKKEFEEIVKNDIKKEIIRLETKLVEIKEKIDKESEKTKIYFLCKKLAMTQEQIFKLEEDLYKNDQHINEKQGE